MQKPKIIINNQSIKIVKGSTITTFDNTTKNIELIKEHLELTPMNALGSAYVVNGGPLTQTIEVLKTRQAELNKPDLPPEYLEALEDLTAKTETESSDTGKAKPPKKPKKAD